MKILLLIRVLLLVLFAGINAGSTKSPENIKTWIQHLVNISPNISEIHQLWNPLQLKFNESFNTENYDFVKPNLTFQSENITISESVTKNSTDKNHYIELTCTFHQQLQISHAIEPENLVIRGHYQTNTSVGIDLVGNFTAKQYSGRLIHKIFNTTNKTELLYSDEEINIGKSGDNRRIIHAIGIVIEDVKNHTLQNVPEKYLFSKIHHFQHIFPFLKNCLLAENRTANKLKQNYTIDNIEQWKSFNLRISQVIIHDINDFKQVNITAQRNGSSGVRFNMTILTNSLEGNFTWSYTKTKNISSEHHFNFTIDHLILTVNADFIDQWTVNYVDAKIGEIRIHRNNTGYPDVNEFMFNILHEHLKILITSHLEKYIRDEYSLKMKKGFDQTYMRELELMADLLYKPHESKSTANLSNTNVSTTSFQESWSARVTPDTSYLYQENVQKKLPNPANHPKPVGCLDGRNLLQKIFFYHLPCNSTETKPECVDNRRWFNVFHRNPCKKNNETITDCKDTRKWYNIFKRNPCKK